MAGIMSVDEKQVRDASRPLILARAEMEAGERLIWAETSSPGGARRRVLPASLLGWLFLLIVLAWMGQVANASLSLLLLGLPFLLIGVALALLPWWWPHVARQTVYAISEQRLLIIQKWPWKKVTSYGPEDIGIVERRDYKDGTGDLIFRREAYQKPRHHQEMSDRHRVGERAIGFFGVPDVRRLEEAVRALKERRHVALSAEDDGISARPGGKRPGDLPETSLPVENDPDGPRSA